MLNEAVTFCRFVVAWLFTLWVSLVACVTALVVGPKRMWVRTAKRWARITLKLVDVRLHIEGSENLAGPAIFVSNHQSLIDVVFMPAILPATVRFVAKRELLWIPLWGWAFAYGGGVLVNRKNPRAALQSLRAGIK